MIKKRKEHMEEKKLTKKNVLKTVGGVIVDQGVEIGKGKIISAISSIIGGLL
jgi:hypothetical protein